MAKGQKEEAENRKTEVAALKSSLQPINERLALVEKQLQDVLVLLPNLPSEKCKWFYWSKERKIGNW